MKFCITQVKKAKKEKAPKKEGGGGKKAEEDDLPVDVRRLDFRVGRIISAELHPNAESLYVEQVRLILTDYNNAFVETKLHSTTYS